MKIRVCHWWIRTLYKRLWTSVHRLKRCLTKVEIASMTDSLNHARHNSCLAVLLIADAYAHAYALAYHEVNHGEISDRYAHLLLKELLAQRKELHEAIDDAITFF